MFQLTWDAFIIHLRLRERLTPTIYRIAIIGGGVGGTSNAFFLKQQLGKDTHITVSTYSFISF